MKNNLEEVMLDLLCKKAVYGLDAAEEMQLTELESKLSSGSQSQSFELTAAAITIADLDASLPMPESLRSRILATAETHFAEKAQAEFAPVPKVVHEPRNSIYGWFPWAVAAAACIALALNIYYTRQQPDVVRNGQTTQTPEQKLTPAQMRERLIASGQALARATWGPGKMSDVRPSGDVVWSDSTQTGYMRLSGLPKNDPAKETYQLWIVAKNQDPKTPVDGGTFDITTDGEVVIPINAKVKAMEPQAFAITIEKPGGVPVSSQEKVPALAKPET